MQTGQSIASARLLIQLRSRALCCWPCCLRSEIDSARLFSKSAGQVLTLANHNGLNITLEHAVAEGDFVAVDGPSDARLANGQAYNNQVSLGVWAAR